MATSLEQIQRSIAPELRELNDRIRASLGSGNELMRRVIDGYLESKGKMIRPILVILASKLYGASGERVIAAAAAVEMLHNASLIHDDVVDESKMRRDRPTINAVWDNHIAVLVGDFFVSTALQQAISTDDLRIVDSLARLGRMLSLGEIDQIYNARYHNLDEEAYYGVISRKTASLFVSCVEMGAYATGRKSKELGALRRFAELLGRCFQIRDDIFDYFDAEAVGKPTGNDLREGKITLPLLHALSLKERPEHEAMMALAMSDELSADDIALLIDYAKRCGGIDYAYEAMTAMRDEARDILCRAYPESEARTALLDIFDYIIARSY